MRQYIYNLFFYLTVIQISYCQQSICKKYIDVRTVDASKEFETICIECPHEEPTYSPYDYNQVLNDKYECISFYNVQNQQDFDCKKVNDRFTCQESYKQCSVLKQKQYEIAETLDLNCAITSEDMSSCIMPKFGFTLVLPSGQFDEMNQTFCAVLNSNTGKCIKYHHRFLQVKDAGYSVFFKDFFNFDKIIQEQSHSSLIVCDNDYKLESINGVQGCLPIAFNNPNCIKQNEYQSCIQCKDDYSINAISGICEQSFVKKCLIQNYQNNKYGCQLCKVGYKLEENQCTNKLENCAIFSQFPPFNCIACKHPFIGRFCEYTNPKVESCELTSTQGLCIKCKTNEFYYFESNGSKCLLRLNSMNCKVKHPWGDYCGQQNQSDMVYYENDEDIGFREQILIPKQHTEKFFNQCDNPHFIRHKEYLKLLGVTFYYPSIKIKYITPVDGCIEYSYLANECVKCNNNRYLWLQSGEYSCREQIPPQPSKQQIGCLDIDQKSQKCIRCKEKYSLSLENQTCEPMTIPNCVYSYQYQNYVDLAYNCILCEDGYKFDKNIRKWNKKCVKVPNCRDWSDYEYKGCDTCLQGSSYMITQNVKSYKLQCMANIENCEIMNNDQCIQCFKGFTLNSQTKKCIKSDQLKFCKISNNYQCLECISDDYILSNNKCSPFCKEKTSCFKQNPNCSECYYSKCVKCNSDNSIKNDCQLQCNDGKVVLDLKDCNSSQNNCNSNCSDCSQTNECKKCKNGTFLLKEGKGECLNVCPSGYFINELSNECIKCSSNCIKCSKLEDCEVCESSQKISDGKCQPQIQCNQSCKKCSSVDYCLECINSKDVLLNGQCLICPIGYFLDKDQCSACPKQCLTCSSSDKCSTCAYSITSLEQNCLCKSDQLLYNNKCVVNCPFGWKANLQSKQCVRMCSEGTYLVYKVDRKEYECSSVLNELSDYCLQFIEQIPSSVQIKLKKVTKVDEYINLFAVFNETPQQCYSYQLFGKSSFEIPLQNVQNPPIHTTQFDIKISKLDLMNYDKVEQNDKYSFLYLKIFYKNFLQYTLRIRITFTFDLILSNEIQYNGEHKIIDPLCEDCEVPAEKQVQSSTTATCPSNTSCENGKISIYTNADLEITQQITDTKYSKNILQPHSLKMKFTDANGKESIFQIKNYYFDNSQLGKIKYTFKAIGGNNGQLIVTSKVFSATSESRVLLSSETQQDVMNSKYWYSTQTFEIEYQDDSEDNQLGQLEIILICVCTLTCSILIIIAIIYICKRRKQNRIKSYINNNQQENATNVKVVVEEPVELLKFDESYQ